MDTAYISEEEFEKFYSTRLEPSMPRLKAEVKELDSWLVVGLAAGLLGIAAFFAWMNDFATPLSGWLIFIFIAIVVFSIIKYANKKDSFTDDFKTNVINEIIHHLNPGMVYKPEKCITEREYKASGLFRQYYDDFWGEDFMMGVYKNVPFRCSEIGTAMGRKTIFSGLFFIAKINGSFTGGTYVWDKDFEQLPSSIADEEYRLMPMHNVVRFAVNNGSFKEYFSVCTTTPSQANRLMSPERLRQMLSFKQQLRGNMAFSFVAGYCYVAIGAAEDILEPSKYPDDKEEILKYYYTVFTILYIIDQLMLGELL